MLAAATDCIDFGGQNCTLGPYPTCGLKSFLGPSPRPIGGFASPPSGGDAMYDWELRVLLRHYWNKVSARPPTPSGSGSAGAASTIGSPSVRGRP